MPVYDKKYLKHLNSLKKAVEKKFSHGKFKLWRNRDFEELSFEINKSTKVLISVATLKRIFGKNKTADTYFPQESTIEALKLYANTGVKTSKPNSKTVWFLALIPVLFAVIFLYQNKKTKVNGSIKAKVELLKSEGNTPATVFFSIQLPETSDSVFISFGDKHPLQFVAPDVKTISHFYAYPGVFEVKLKTREKIISDTLQVFIPTNGWQSLASYYQQDYHKRFYPIPLPLVTNNHVFHPTKKNLATIGMDTTRIIVVQISNYKNTGVNADSFRMVTRLKNVYFWPAIRCYSAFVSVIGSKGIVRFKITNKGCSGFGEYVLSEKKRSGRNADLTAFALDIKEWTDIEIINNRKNVEVKLNSDTVLTDKYSQTLGDIMGISIEFHGSGYVDFVELYDRNNTPVFKNHFNKLEK